MITLYLPSMIGCMFVGSFVIFSVYATNQQKRVTQFRLRTIKHRRRPLAATPRRFVPSAMLNF
jgi:hypothetical protein